ncbi:MAG: hypothetical protein NT090_26400 [Acidobacteria bacterium]|nr:hypothetical protein [Acidobacteriota bacterium]
MIARCYDDDGRAFELVHKEWFPRLCVFFRYFGIEPADAGDLALMSLFKVARTAVRGGRFEHGEGRPFAAWIHRIARNSMFEMLIFTRFAAERRAFLRWRQRFRKAAYGGAITARAEWSFALEGQ